MYGIATLVLPNGSRVLDERDLGCGRSVAGTLVRLLALVAAGVAACAACWTLGTRQRPFYIPRMSHIPGRVVMVDYLPDEALYLGLAFLLLPAGIYLLRVLLLGAPRLLELARRARDHWQMRQPLVTRLGSVPEGRWVRVRGQVVGGSGFTSAGGQPHAVLASYLGSVGGISDRGGRAHYKWELHGIDFQLALEQGEEAIVRVSHATVVERPARIPPDLASQRPLASRAVATDHQHRDQVACVYRERVVRSGDWIEVMGLLRREVDPQYHADPRGVRLRPFLVSTQFRRLLIDRARIGRQCGAVDAPTGTDGDRGRRRSSTPAETRR